MPSVGSLSPLVQSREISLKAFRPCRASTSFADLVTKLVDSWSVDDKRDCRGSNRSLLVNVYPFTPHERKGVFSTQNIFNRKVSCLRKVPKRLGFVTQNINFRWPALYPHLLWHWVTNSVPNFVSQVPDFMVLLNKFAKNRFFALHQIG